MAFIWNTQPNPTSTDLPIPVPPGQITYEQKEVANLVNAGGTLSYNTPNIGFDILYQLPSANINVAYFTDATFNNITLNTANITTASINVARINVANILNANILYGFVGSDPTSNLGIANKHYVDAAMANVPSGGSDLQNLIDAKGDLIVGIGPNTATRLPVGTDGQLLISDGTSNTGLRWIDITGQEQFFNLTLQTHYNIDSNDHVVLLRSAAEIIMNDGTRTAGWFNKTADIEVMGAGGLDQGMEEANTWYEVHAIRNSSNNATNLLLHRGPRTTLDQSFLAVTDFGVTLGRVTGGTATKIAQSFIPTLAGPLTSVELEISKTGSPTGLMWITLEADSGGFPSGTALATSRVMDVSRLPTDKARMRFLFDTNTSVSLSTTYHLVYQSDYTASDVNYTTIWGLIADGYGSGRASEFRVAWFTSVNLSGAADLWFKTFVKEIAATAATMPAGYDQRCLISYVHNDANGRFKQYTQKNHNLVMGTGADWRAFTSITGLVESVDLTRFLPPVACSVQFVSYTTIGTPKLDTPIGGVACTDMNPGIGFSPGAAVANTRGTDTTNVSPQVAAALHEMLIVEDSVVLTRMHNTDCRIYVTQVTF